MSIDNLQTAGSASAPTAVTAAGLGVNKICGLAWNADVTMTGASAAMAAYQLTACTFQTPFKVGVHFDSDEAIGSPNDAHPPDALAMIENAIAPMGLNGLGTGYNGFWLAYWQNTC